MLGLEGVERERGGGGKRCERVDLREKKERGRREERLAEGGRRSSCLRKLLALLKFGNLNGMLDIKLLVST